MATTEPSLDTKQVILKNLYRNGKKVPVMFRNGELIYYMLQKLVFEVDTDNLKFPISGGTQTITITANDDWVMTIPEWLTASKSSGMSSSTVSLTAGSTETGREGSIVITCGDKTHTIVVKQYSVRFVSCIYLDSQNFPMQNPSPNTYMLNSGIYPAQDVEVRIGYIGTGVYNGSTVAGFYGDFPDNNDFRYFTYSNSAYLDAGSQRLSTSTFATTSNGVTYDLSFGSLWLYNNLTDTYILNGNPTTIRTDVTIGVDIASIKLKSLQIKNGGVVVFDGKAAVDNNGAGLYDTISGSMIRSTTGISLTYDE